MSILANASNVAIGGGTFNIYQVSPLSATSPLDLLASNIASGAFHNSAARYDPPKCHPNTRQAILQSVMNWLDDLEKSTHITWIYGSAGIGKSAIAQSIAELCFKRRCLAGSFFFARGAPNQHTESHFISTLAYQMIRCIPEARIPVLNAIENDPQIFSLSLEDQMQTMIIGPLNSTAQNDHEGHTLRTRSTVLIVVDGLDECDCPKSQRRVLGLLTTAIQQLSIPLSILITCRPEQIIRETFNEEPLSSLTRRMNLDHFSIDTSNDIKTFFESEFETIKRNHPAKDHFPPVWPTHRDMANLMIKSSGQFVYASTVVKYLGSRRHPPLSRLAYILNQSIPENDAPFAALDTLYHHILSSVTDTDNMIKILGLVLGNSPNVRNAIMIERFLSLQPGSVHTIFSDLHSVVFVPEDSDEVLRIYHTSFSDFLLDRIRAKEFFLNIRVIRSMITSTIIKKNFALFSNGDLMPMLLAHYEKSDLTSELLEALYMINLAEVLCLQSPLNITRLRETAQFLLWFDKKKNPHEISDLFTYHIVPIVKCALVMLSALASWTADSEAPQAHDGGTIIDPIIQFLTSMESICTHKSFSKECENVDVIKTYCISVLLPMSQSM